MKKLYSLGILALLALIVLVITGCAKGRITVTAAETACLQLEDIYFDKFDCCDTDFPGCGGVENAYSKAGCGTLTCGPPPVYECPCDPALYPNLHLNFRVVDGTPVLWCQYSTYAYCKICSEGQLWSYDWMTPEQAEQCWIQATEGYGYTFDISDCGTAEHRQCEELPYGSPPPP